MLKFIMLGVVFLLFGCQSSLPKVKKAKSVRSFGQNEFGQKYLQNLSLIIQNDKSVLSSDDGGNLNAWSLKNSQRRSLLTDEQFVIIDMSISSDGKKLLANTTTGIKLINLKDKKVIASYDINRKKNLIISSTLSKDNRLIHFSTVSFDSKGVNTIYLLDVNTNKLVMSKVMEKNLHMTYSAMTSDRKGIIIYLLNGLEHWLYYFNIEEAKITKKHKLKGMDSFSGKFVLLNNNIYLIKKGSNTKKYTNIFNPKSIMKKVMNMDTKKEMTTLADVNAFINETVTSIANESDIKETSEEYFISIVNINNFNDEKVINFSTSSLFSTTALAVDRNEKYLLIGDANGKILEFNLQNKRKINEFKGHIKSISHLSFYDNGTKFASSSRDSTIKLWKINHSKELIKMTSFSDGGWLSIVEEGFFVTNKPNLKQLSLTNTTNRALEAVGIRQLYDSFYKPDLITFKLTGDEEAYKKLIGELDINEALKNPPPIVQINSMKQETSEDKIKLSYTIRDKGKGVGLIRIYQEGKLIKSIGTGKDKRKISNSYTFLEQDKLDILQKKRQKEYIASREKQQLKKSSISMESLIPNIKPSYVTNKAGIHDVYIDLKSGKNEIAIEVFNKTNTVLSYRDTVVINANIPKRKPKFYAIVAGVNNFEHKSVESLHYSENDAIAIKETIENKMKTVFADVEVHLLLGKDVTRANILTKAKEISTKARLEDTVLFYISTHGTIVEKRYKLIPYNNKIGYNNIDFEDTFKAIQSIKALNQIFVIDSCHSGQAIDNISTIYDSKASVLAKSSGVHILSATTKGTSAFESNDPNIKNGVFTYRVLEALKNRETDINHDDFISVIELSKELKKPQSNADFQYPVIRNLGSDIRLERVQ